MSKSELRYCTCGHSELYHGKVPIKVNNGAKKEEGQSYRKCVAKMCNCKEFKEVEDENV